VNTYAQARFHAHAAAPAANESEGGPLGPPGDFVGRQRELEQLVEGLGHAERRAGSLFLLVGEAGIGKTRLADELCERAIRRGFAIHWGRCWESGGAPAYWPWTQIVSALLRDDGSLAPDAMTCARHPLAPILFPELAGDAPEGRFRTFRASIGLLAQATRRCPLVLVLDDLHAADQSSLLLLEFVARELRGLPVLIIGTHRDLEASREPELGPPLARIVREARILPVRRLAPADVDVLVRRRIPEIPAASAATLFAATMGNPRSLDQVVRTWEADSGAETRPLEITSGSAPPDFQLRREGEFWSLRFDQSVIHLKHSRGLETLERLLSHPDRDFHAIELAALAPGATDIGDAGELLDAEARAAYRARLTDLEAQVEQADAFADVHRARRAREEIDFLAAELSRAVGLSGRSRRAGVAADRARVTVQKRLRSAIRRIEERAPQLGRYLSQTVRTGTFCVYRPASSADQVHRIRAVARPG
jgi:hypothetical protein